MGKKVFDLQNIWQSIRQYATEQKKKVLIGAIALVGLGAGAAGGTAYYQSQLVSLYPVTVDGTEVGLVSRPIVVEAWMEKTKNKVSQQLPDGAQVILAQEVRVEEPVKVFRGKGEDQQVTQALSEKVDLQVQATQLLVDGQVVASLIDEEAVNGVLNAIKSRYAPPARSEVALASRSAERSEDGVQVRFLEQVSTRVATVSIDQLMEVEEAYQLIQNGTLQEQTHVIQQGETLSHIAVKYGLTIAQLLANNPGITEDTILQIGQELVVTAKQPLISVQTITQVTEEVKIPYQREVQKDSSMPKGQRKVTQQGQQGLKLVTYEVTAVNGVTTHKKPIEEKVIREPVHEKVIEGTKVIAGRGTGKLAWPTVGGYISSPYGMRWGRMHTGIDIARPSDRTIKAADNGRVVFAGWDGGYGKTIVIDHGNGLRTRYAHLSSISVKVGQIVEKGQKIGTMGSTGNSTGVHLHFEVLKNGKPVNPRNYL